jgi:phosphoglycerate dehydrogenase-like enzyme
VESFCIGSEQGFFSELLKALGASILYTARSPRPEAVGTFRTLDQLLAEADIVSLHVPLSDQTRGLIGAATLARMKPGAVLVNTARGELVDEAALADALRSGRLAGAGLDVLTGEPVRAGHPLFALENLVVTPHISWLTPETIERSLGIAFENCRRLGAGEKLLHEVPPPGTQSG